MNIADLGMTILIWYCVTIASGIWLSHRDKMRNKDYAGDAFYLTAGAVIGGIAAFFFNYGEKIWTMMFGS